MGAMIEADLFVLMGLIYSAVVCMGSMAMYWWLELKPGWEWLADAIVLAWIGISMSVIAFFKVWMVSHNYFTIEVSNFKYLLEQPIVQHRCAYKAGFAPLRLLIACVACSTMAIIIFVV